MLHLSAVNTFYARAHILRDVDLRVGEGEAVALIGPNGAGKSTLLKTIMGLVKPKSGMITYNGTDITNSSSHKIARMGIGYVPEERRIFPKLTVLENLRAGEKGATSAENPWTVERVVELFPKLEELLDRPGGNLSGGEQQMLTLGRTLMGNPGLLLLDEPTEGLAPVIVEQVVEAVKALKEQGLSVLLSEQNHRAVTALCDRVCELSKGEAI